MSELKTLASALILSILMAAAMGLFPNTSFAQEADTWTDFARMQDGRNALWYSYNPQTVFEKHGLTIVEVRETWTDDKAKGSEGHQFATLTKYALDCVRGRFLTGTVETHYASGKVTTVDMSDIFPWRPIYRGNFLFVLASKAC